MEDGYVFPEYWYAKITKDNIELIQKWRKCKFGFNSDISDYNYIDYAGLGHRAGGLAWFFWVSNNELLKYVLKDYINDDVDCNENLIKLLKEIKLMKTFLLKNKIPTIKFSMLPDGVFYEGELPGEEYTLAVCPTNEKMVIVDIDCKENKLNGYDYISKDIFNELIQSFHYKTKSGGMHIFLHYTGNKVLLNTTSKFAIDLRVGKNSLTGNNGGYVSYNGPKDIRQCIHLIKESSNELNKWLESLFCGVNYGK